MGSRREETDPKDEKERERLREAAAQALGLELGKEGTVSSSQLEDSQVDDEHDPPPSASILSSSQLHKPTNPYNSYLGASFSPSSLTSLPTTQSHFPPSVTTTAPAPMGDSLPPFPCSMSALTTYTQASAVALKFYPPPTFLALSFNRRAKQWKMRFVIFTSPAPSKRSPLTMARPHADFLNGAGVFDPLYGRHSHLHLFNSPTPEPDELEMERLEIDEDTVIYVAESEVAGKKDVLKVGGRSVLAVKIPTGSKPSEEQSRTMWQLKFSDLQDAQQWFGYVRTSVLQQRAERASLNFSQWTGNNTPVMPTATVRTDMDAVLGRAPSITSTPSFVIQSPKPISPTPTQSMFRSMIQPPPSNPAPLVHVHSPNPRYVDHVGAAPSRDPTTGSMRTRTHPPPSALNNALPALRNLFRSPAPSIRSRNSAKDGDKESISASLKDKEPQNIDPIPAEDTSLGHRAATLLNLFRSTSTRHTSDLIVSTHSNGVTIPPIGTPITETPNSESPPRSNVKRTASESTKLASHHRVSSVDWSIAKEDVPPESPAVVEEPSATNDSLPPPPRNTRRSAMFSINGVPSKGKRSTSPPSVRPVSIQSTSNSSYLSASELPVRSSTDPERRRSRTNTGSSIKPSPRSPSPIFEDRDGLPSSNGNGNIYPANASVSSVSVSMWGAQHPYSKRVSTNSALSVNTVSTGHGSFNKHPPPPRPPPSFAPPPAPSDAEPSSSTSVNGSVRDSVVSRNLRLSLNPPLAPPTQSLPPRPDEPGFRHRRSVSGDARPNGLHVLSGSAASSTHSIHPPAPPPPNGPLPPTPNADKEPSIKSYRRGSLTRRLRNIGSPSSPTSSSFPPQSQNHAPKDALLRPPLQLHEINEHVHPYIGEPIIPHDDLSPTFLNIQDTPVTPAIPLGQSFLLDDDEEETALSPPPRRGSRNSKELRSSKFNPEKDVSKSPVVSTVPPPSEPRDSGVGLELL